MTFLPRGKPFTAGPDPRRNPGGRTLDGKTKAGETLLEVLRAEISHLDIAQAARELLDARDPRTVHYLIDRELGRPAQSIIVSGDAERPLHMLVGVGERDLTPLAPQEALPAPVEGDGATVYLDDEEGEEDTSGFDKGEPDGA